ncbi:MAG: hypothetical protein RL885_08320 [Planctomycetota bacterium]
MLRRCCVVTVLLIVSGPGCNPPPAPPNVPRNPMAVAVSRDQIDVSWVDGSNDETSFEVERRLPGGTFELVGTVAANVVTFSDTGLDFETALSISWPPQLGS